MDNAIMLHNLFKQKGKGVKVYSGRAKGQPPTKQDDVPEEQKACDCRLCRISKGIDREVRGQFMRYGKV